MTIIRPLVADTGNAHYSMAIRTNVFDILESYWIHLVSSSVIYYYNTWRFKSTTRRTFHEVGQNCAANLYIHMSSL